MTLVYGSWNSQKKFQDLGSSMSPQGCLIRESCSYHKGHQECTLVYNMSMSALVQVAAINGALVQVAAIISALVQLGCHH